MQSAMMLIEILLMYIAFINLSKLRLEKQAVLIFIFITWAISLFILYIGSADLGFSTIALNVVFVLMMVITANRIIKNLPLSIFYALIAELVFLLTGSIAGTITDFFIDPINARELIINDWSLYIVSMVIYFPMNYLLSRWLGNLIEKKLKIFTDELKRKFAVYIIIGAIITLSLFFTNLFLPAAIEDAALLSSIYTISLAALFIYLIFTIYTFTDNLSKEIEVRHKEEMMATLNTYTSNIENAATEMRRFRHDHINLLRGLHSYIENNDMDGVRTFYEKYAVAFTKSSDAFNLTLDSLQYIKIPELKSLLSLKLMYAQEAGIDVYIEVIETIEDLKFDLIDLCRVTGILLDNAIEACREVTGVKSTLKFAAIKKSDRTIFLFINSCVSPPPISRIFEKGFSTKGDGRGLGLSSVQTILNKNNDVSLDSYMDDEYFIQELAVV